MKLEKPTEVNLDIIKRFIKLAVQEAMLDMEDLTKQIVKNAVLEVLIERKGE